jgi:hypothetical protein
MACKAFRGQAESWAYRGAHARREPCIEPKLGGRRAASDNDALLVPHREGLQWSPSTARGRAGPPSRGSLPTPPTATPRSSTSRSAWCRSTSLKGSTTSACHPPPRPPLNRCRRRLQDGTYNALPEQLRDYLIERLTPDAAERHIGAGLGASAVFEALQEQRLTRPNGSRRLVAVNPTGEFIDCSGGCWPTWPRGLR